MSRDARAVASWAGRKTGGCVRDETAQDPQPTPVVTGRRYGAFVLKPTARRLLREDTELKVEDRVFDLIMLLLQHRDRALDRREIIDTLWGSPPISDATLRQLVHKARRALDDDGERQGVIRTLYGRSLQWVDAVEPVQDVDVGNGDTDGAQTWPSTDRRATPARATPVRGAAYVMPTPVPSAGWFIWRASSTVLLLVLLACVGVLWWRSRSRRERLRRQACRKQHRAPMSSRR